MKLKKVAFISIFLFIVSLVIISFFSYIRGIEILVIDEKTKQPLHNINAIYSIELAGLDISKMGYYYRKVSTSKFKVINGVLIINPKIILKLPWEKPGVELIYLNIDLRNSTPEKKLFDFVKYFNIHDFEKENVEKFFNPNVNYRGFIVCSTSWALDESKQGGTKRKYFDILWNSEGLVKDSQRITVALKRHKL